MDIYINNISTHLKSICFVDQRIGWLVGSQGTILKMIDGENWISQTRRATDSTYYSLASIQFPNESIGFVIGHDFFGLGWSVLKTTDGGDNWTTLLNGTTNSLGHIYFVEPNTGWASGEVGTILKSTDGGESWASQVSGTNESLGALQFIDHNTGWVVGKQGIILKTSNGGENWNSQVSGTTNDLVAVYFINESTGWVVGYDGIILKTTNGGANWFFQFSGFTPNFYSSVYFTDYTTGWVVGTNGIIIKTINGGENWLLQPSGTNYSLFSVHFVDSNKGWTVGLGGILCTNNGGVDWTPQHHVGGYWLFSVFFVDPNTGWIVGNGGTILKTTTGGTTFIQEEEIEIIPSEFSLSQNYPNPFNPSTTIRYSLPQSSNVVIKVYDVLGNEIETLVDEEKPIGTFEITWYAEGLPSGVYFYTLDVQDKFFEVKKMLLLK